MLRNRLGVVLLLMLMITFFSLPVLAVEKPVIKEVIIIGPTRSSEDIIVRQLPFREGDYWDDSFKDLTYRRIAALNIFNPMELKMVVEPVEEDYVRVVIRATDTEIFYTDPVELVVMKLVDLCYQEFNLVLRNPAGNGFNIEAGLSWSSNPWWKVGTSYAAGSGFTLHWLHTDYKINSRFNGISYHVDGFNEKISIKQIPAADWQFKYILKYLDNNYQVEGSTEERQKYLIGEMEALWTGFGELQMNISRGQSLEDTQPHFNKLILDFVKEYPVSAGKFILRLQGGITSPETPLNMQFHGGGFSQIPLRGYNYNLAGDRFARGTIEFHKPVFTRGLQGIIFIDCGKIVPAGGDFNGKEWLLDGGIGLAYDTPMGIPVRCDIGFNQQGEYNWNIGLGHSF